MKSRLILPSLCIALLMESPVAQSQPVQPQVTESKAYNAKQNKLSSLFPDAVIARGHLNTIRVLVDQYRALKNGRWPETFNHVQWVLMKESGVTSRESFADAGRKLFNSDVSYSKDTALLKYGISPYIILSKRPDGASYDSPRSVGTRDALAFTELYYTSNYRADGRLQFNPRGGYLVLWRNGEIDAVPYDQALYTPSPIVKGLTLAFSTQAGVNGGESISFEELRSTLPPTKDMVSKPILEDREEPVADNGGPESLVTFSRLLNSPNRYGIEREKMWNTFSPTEPQFTLKEVQSGSRKLNLPLQLRTIALDELQQINAPAIFMTSDDKRIVTLSNLDDKEAIVIDRGLTRIVSHEVLAKRYSGEALLPQAAAEAVSSVVADDPIRIIPLTSTAEEIAQEVKITNRGTQPLTLQIERPIPGVTQADLSADTLAPGQTATLSLKMKWREVLKGETQNVLVYLRTNDPLRPRLPLGFQLRAPQAIQP